MLQALGSSTNAKIAYFMLGSCCVLIIGTFIFVAKYERVVIDDTYAYCATAYFSQKTGYRVEYWKQRNDFDKIDTGCARACYKEQKSTLGLSFLEIETQAGYADHNQAFSAGILEGTLTWMSIYAQWKNTIQSFCEQDEATDKFCTWMRSIIARNHENSITIAMKEHKTSHYHHQIYLFYQQLYGIEKGFRQGTKRARKDFEIPSEDFLLLNARVDIEDLKVYYNKFVQEEEEDMIEMHDTVEKMIINLVDGESPKIIIGHSSDGEYNSMLKIVKTYRFNYHHGPTPSHHLVTNTDITFTSYPGCIASTDDFYLAHGKHSRIIVSGIKLKYGDDTQVHGIDLDSAVLMSVRVMAAIRLAHNGKSWAKYMAQDPDIGAKQWLVIDEKRLKYLYVENEQHKDEEFVTSLPTIDDSLNNEIPTDNIGLVEKEEEKTTVMHAVNSRNIVWMIDNTWKRLHGEDVTERFKKDLAWNCDGVPYFKVIQELNKIDGRDFKLNSEQIDNLDELGMFLKQNAYRGDLKEDEKEIIPYGNTDIKLYSTNGRKFIIQNGPVQLGDEELEQNDNGDAFDWAKFDNEVSHDEHPDSWNFPKVQVQYIWH
ncbi:hypothetical protein PVAND_011103 [Polypedilum vanderplanki]|uniref:Phospholipase B-like n=1 Tax=Polypedilum vanderplanki TaxID=319348 RepID=A0A9J6CI38_POLVA|nr:hypothetical protein PVAND_011103 [Polypedilum vanderplanki]